MAAVLVRRRRALRRVVAASGGAGRRGRPGRPPLGALLRRRQARGRLGRGALPLDDHVLHGAARAAGVPQAAKRHELILGALVVLGVVLLLRLEVHGSSKGYAMGIASAFFSAAFGTWNGSVVLRERAERVTVYELAAAGIACGLSFVVLGDFVAPWEVTLHDWGLLAFLAVACTLLPWLWSLRILRTLSPYTVAISVSLEPVYSILFAFLLWPNEERLTARFYVGGGLLIALVVVNGALKGRRAAAPG